VNKGLLIVAGICILVLVASRSVNESNGATQPVPLAVLTAVGTLGLGATVGTYVGAREAHRLREATEKERRDRERDGLLRLLYTEVSQNELNIAHVSNEIDDPVIAKSILAMRGRYVNAEAWKALRVNLAQHLSSQHLAVLADYYKNVLLLEEVVTVERAKKDRDFNHQTSSDIIFKTKFLLQALQEQGDKVLELIQAQVPDVTVSDRYAETIRKQALPNPPNSKSQQQGSE
jgi:hypothetical protein